MNIEDVKHYTRLFHERELPEVVGREVKPSFVKGQTTAIIGPRRSGKTYLLYSLIGEDREKYVYLNFENPRSLG